MELVPYPSSLHYLNLRISRQTALPSPKGSLIIDTFLATVLDLLVLEAALLPAESVSRVGKDSIASSIASSFVGSIIRKWTRHSDN